MYTRLIEHFYLYCTTIPISSILHVQGGQIALVIPPQLARLIVDAVRDVVIDPLLARILVANTTNSRRARRRRAAACILTMAMTRSCARFSSSAEIFCAETLSTFAWSLAASLSLGFGGMGWDLDEGKLLLLPMLGPGDSDRVVAAAQVVFESAWSFSTTSMGVDASIVVGDTDSETLAIHTPAVSAELLHTCVVWSRGSDTSAAAAGLSDVGVARAGPCHGAATEAAGAAAAAATAAEAAYSSRSAAEAADELDDPEGVVISSAFTVALPRLGVVMGVVMGVMGVVGGDLNDDGAEPLTTRRTTTLDASPTGKSSSRLVAISWPCTCVPAIERITSPTRKPAASADPPAVRRLTMGGCTWSIECSVTPNRSSS